MVDHRYLRSLVILALWGAAMLPAVGDTLELKNGEIKDGFYMGGTQNSVRFSVAGVIETIPVGDVLALTFSGGQDLSAIEPEPRQAEPVVATVRQPEPVASSVLAPAGAQLLVRMVDAIDSRQHKVGHRFAATLEGDFAHNGYVIAPRGSQVYGIITDANQAGRLKGKTWLELELREIRINDTLHPIVTGDYELAGKKSSGKRTALTTLGGAALGAIIGGDGDRGEGAAIGAGAGLAVSAITKGEQLQVPSGTLIDFRLAAPFIK